jgi:hypothetical protein
MNGIDLVIIVVLIVAAASGARRGFYSSLLDLACVFGGILIGLVGYPLGVWLFRRVLGLGDLLAGPLGFALMVVIGVVAIAYLGRLFAAKPPLGGDEEDVPLSKASRFAGAVLGMALAVIGLSAFLVLAGMGAAARQVQPEWHGVPEQSATDAAEEASDQVSRSRLAQPLIALVPIGLQTVELTGLKLPRVTMVPRSFDDAEYERGLRRVPTFRPINFTKLDGGTCIKCGAAVDFVGYVRKGGSFPFPKFKCPKCGRTSDGCQLFEGFHAMYHACPYDVADRGGTLDCGVWTNNDPVVPQGKCPVCGRTLQLRAEARY